MGSHGAAGAKALRDGDGHLPLLDPTATDRDAEPFAVVSDEVPSDRSLADRSKRIAAGLPAPDVDTDPVVSMTPGRQASGPATVGTRRSGGVLPMTAAPGGGDLSATWSGAAPAVAIAGRDCLDTDLGVT